MFDFLVRGVKRVFGYGDTGSTDNSVTSPLTEQAQSERGSTSTPASSTRSDSQASTPSPPAPKRARRSSSKRKVKAHRSEDDREPSASSSSKVHLNNRNVSDHIPPVALSGVGRKAAGKKVTLQLPSPTPDAIRNSGRPRSKGKAPKQAHQATVEEDVEMSDDTATSAPSPARTRPNRQPKRQQDIRRKPNKPQAVSIPNIVIEESTAEKPLPNNYSGTIIGIQYYTPDYTQDHKCGHINEHKLVCNHWVKSSAPCGTTCRDAIKTVEAFICPTCLAAAQDAITNKTTPQERYTLSLVLKGPHTRLMTWITELLARHYPSLTAGVPELSQYLATGTYGRPCEVSEGPVSYLPVQDLAREVAKTLARQKKAIEDPLTKHPKRGSDEPTTANKKIKRVKHNTISIAGTKRSIFEPDTIPSGPFTPLALPRTPKPSKRQRVSYYTVANFSGTKRCTPPINLEAERDAKRFRAEAVVVKKGVKEIKWYGNVAVLRLPNGGNRVISRDMTAQRGR